MKILLILRHAKSSLKDSSVPDHDRPLDELAKQDALLMGKLLRDRGLIPDFIMSSTALRAKTTTDLVVEGCKYREGKIIFEQSLYQAKPKDYMKILAGLSDRYVCILLVGHNPTVEEVIEILTGPLEITMSPCALAYLNLPIENWIQLDKHENNIRAELLGVLRL
jgi:phosphohistidine phosphatase